MTTTIAKLATVAELREANRCSVENDLESIAFRPPKELGSMRDYFVDSNIALRDAEVSPRMRILVTGHLGYIGVEISKFDMWPKRRLRLEWDANG